MISSDAEHFFQSDRDIELAEIRAKKRTTIGRIAGQPFEIPSKVMDFVFLSVKEKLNLQLVTAESGHIARLIDLNTMSTIAIYRGHTGPVTSVCIGYDFTFNHQFLFTASWDKSVKMFDIHTRTCLKTFKGHHDFVKKVKVIGEHLLTCSADSTLKKWNILSGKEVSTFKGHTRGVEDMAVDDDYKFMYSCSSDTQIRKWVIESGECVHVFEGHLTGVYQLTLDDGIIWSASADKSVKRWNLETLAEDDTILHSDFVKSVVTHGRFLITGGRDENIRIWDLSSCQLLYTIPGYIIEPLSFSKKRHYGEINSLRIRGHYLYSGGLDGTIRRWSLLETDLEKMDKIIEAEPEMIQDFGGGSVLTDEEQKELDELMLNNE